MRNLITSIFTIFFVLVALCTVVVGIAWLFDAKPNNLYLTWEFLGKGFIVSLLFQILFGEKW